MKRPPREGLARGPSSDNLEGIKHAYMQRDLEQAGGVQKRAAKLLGMSFRSSRYYLEKYRLREGLRSRSEQESRWHPDRG